MAAAVVLGATGAIRAGSSPVARTTFFRTLPHVVPDKPGVSGTDWSLLAASDCLRLGLAQILPFC